MTTRVRWLTALAAITATAAACGATTAAGPAASAAPRASRPIAPPRPIGTLRVTGALRDGGAVRATGLSWKPGRLPRGDRLLSFAVAYQWFSCRADNVCKAAADTTATPFAASRYVIGHADVGHRLKLTETATETVETSPATFTFVVSRFSATRMLTTAARGYRTGQAPRTEFVNGLPEKRTGSNSEFFSVDPPHFAASAGKPVLSYRIDGGRWRAMPPKLAFNTGLLRIGRHAISVRTSDRAGATELHYRWQVTRLPAPLACHRPSSPCWLPPHLSSAGKPMRWDWQIGRVAPLERTGASAVDIYDLDGFLTTKAQVHTIRALWQAATLPHPKTVCYLDLAWEDYRPDGSPGQRAGFPTATLGNVYFGFPQERFVDFRQLNELKPMINARLAMCAHKGFDAVELDDIDTFDPPSTTGFHLTPGDAQNLLAYAFNEIHRLGMTGLWKNSPLLSWWGRRYSDGAIVEECYAFSQCFASSLRGSSQYGLTCTALAGRTPCGWDDFSTDKTAAQPTGKWVGEVEYGADHFVCDPGIKCKGPHRFANFCRTVYAPSYGFSAMKLDVDLDGAQFLPCPAGK